jgi:hypothetical protein
MPAEVVADVVGNGMLVCGKWVVGGGRGSWERGLHAWVVSCGEV